MSYAVVTDDDGDVRFFEDRREAYGEAMFRAQHHMISHSVSVLCHELRTWTTVLTLADDRMSVTINTCEPCKREVCTKHTAEFWDSPIFQRKASMQSPGTHPMDVMHR